MLIFEAGNNHFGNYDKALDMIRIAKECGGDAIKFQAIDPVEMEKIGSMDLGFYLECAFSVTDYNSLCTYARKEIGIECFFSYVGITPKQVPSYYKKYSLNADKNLDIKEIDKKSSIVSIPKNMREKAVFKKARVMYSSPYLVPKAGLNWIGKYSNFMGRRVGYSDHSLGIETCKRALFRYEIPILETHMHIGDPIEWKGKMFRDSIHGKQPKELEELAKIYHDKAYKEPKKIKPETVISEVE